MHTNKLPAGAEELIFTFFVYSVIGWLYEETYAYIIRHNIENRGFLTGPLCPIYGFSALFIIFMTATINSKHEISDIDVFLIAMIGSAVIELITSFWMEKAFGGRWWDYSDWPMNLHGRISVFSSIGFGFAGWLLIHSINPVVSNAISKINTDSLRTIDTICLLLLLADMLQTVRGIYHFR